MFYFLTIQSPFVNLTQNKFKIIQNCKINVVQKECWYLELKVRLIMAVA